MKRFFILAISLAMIFSGIIAVVPASAASVEFTSDIEIDFDVFKGNYIENDNVDSDSVIVWADVKESKYSQTKEYGTFIYQAVKDSSIDFSKGAFNPATVNEDNFSFATRFDTSKLLPNIEYAVKAYVKTGDTYTLSKTTAYIIINTSGSKTFDILIHGPYITYEDQDSGAAIYARDEVITSYYVYLDGELKGVTNDLEFNVVDDLFDEDGGYDETSHDVTVKAMSGVGNGGESTEYSFTMQPITTRAEFLQIGSSDDTNQDAQNYYYILEDDIDLTNSNWKSWTLVDGNWKKDKKLHSMIKYFADTLDGRGHKITLNYDSTNAQRVPQDGGQIGGLFGKFCESGYVRNLNFEFTGTYSYNCTELGGERASAFAMIGHGDYDNCFMTADLDSLTDSRIRRDSFVGFPSNYTANNLIAKITLRVNGELMEDRPSHDNPNHNCGTTFHWESSFTPEANNLIMISHAALGADCSVGPKSGKNCTYYNSISDFLTGTNGVIVDQSGWDSMNRGDIREGIVYDVGWDESIWEFSTTSIKFFGRTIYE